MLLTHSKSQSARKGSLSTNSCGPHAQILPEYQLDAARWQEVDQAWSSRMGPQVDAFAVSVLSGFYHTMHRSGPAAPTQVGKVEDESSRFKRFNTLRGIGNEYD